ncbi:MAG: TlpA family protein disulfide reductase [Lachnospiraceae bacterium]|nr:TlpA family protein disulfide reductase [Lachnospiraceae bacterium]
MKKINGKMECWLCLLLLCLLVSACSVPLKEETSGTGKETSSQPAAETTKAEAGTKEAAPSQTETETVQPAPRFLETVDLEGKQVFLSEVCAAQKLTMVNLWASWCPPCIRELPELEALHQKYQADGLAVVGILLDAMDGGLKDGKDLIKQAGVTYLNVMPTAELLAFVSSQYIPVTFFLNEKGELVGEAVIGADPDAYERQIKELLK